MERRKTTIMGTQIDAVTRAEALSRIENFLQTGHSHVVTPNAEFILQARKNKEFQKVLNNADLAVLDGSGPKIASWFTAVELPEIIPGSDLVKSIMKIAGEKQAQVMLLNPASSLSGSTEIERSVSDKFPGVEFQALSLAPDEYSSKVTREKIKKFSPEVLFVGFGSPQQDLWISENLKRFSGVRLAMGIGGSFDFISGKRGRAPRWMRKCGLEWLHRLFSKPKSGNYYFTRRVKKIFRSVIWFPIVFVFTLNKG